MTGRTMAELGFRTTTLAAANGPGWREGEPVDRRAFLTDGAGAAVTLFPLLSGADDQPPGRIGTRNVRAVHQAVSTIYAHDHDHGSAALRQKASQALHQAYG